MHARRVDLLFRTVPDHDTRSLLLVLEKGGAYGAGKAWVVELDGEIRGFAVLAFLTPGRAEFGAAGIEPEVGRAVARLVRIGNKLGFDIDGHGADGAGIAAILEGEGFAPGSDNTAPTGRLCDRRFQSLREKVASPCGIKPLIPRGCAI